MPERGIRAFSPILAVRCRHRGPVGVPQADGGRGGSRTASRCSSRSANAGGCHAGCRRSRTQADDDRRGEGDPTPGGCRNGAGEDRGQPEPHRARAAADGGTHHHGDGQAWGRRRQRPAAGHHREFGGVRRPRPRSLQAESSVRQAELARRRRTPTWRGSPTCLAHQRWRRRKCWQRENGAGAGDFRRGAGADCDGAGAAAAGAAGDDAGRSDQTVTVTAPLAGKVLELSVVDGEFRNEISTPLMTIADLSRVWATSEVPESKIRYCKMGGQRRPGTDRLSRARSSAPASRASPIPSTARLARSK